uniref:Uncharacterized protein n=1 Tax=Rhizoctonia solani TaxID=456999 RepID=N0ABV0_9AGAM|nr:hypothetical protein RSOL_m00890 [Rhizoctonia solani]AGK45410.1 hypothetical protein RSOL_m00890 [Rhizoctonia solani]
MEASSIGKWRNESSSLQWSSIVNWWNEFHHLYRQLEMTIFCHFLRPLPDGSGLTLAGMIEQTQIISFLFIFINFENKSNLYL